MDELLRKALRNIDEADPLTFLSVGRMLERSGAHAELFSDLLERLLRMKDALFLRNGNTFEIAWSLKQQHRRGLHLTIMDGGVFHVYDEPNRRPEIHATLSENNFSFLLRLIIQHQRLSPPTSQFLQTLQSSILENHAISCELLPAFSQDFEHERRYRYLFAVVTKIHPQKDWLPDYHLRFEFVRAVYRDLLEVSIEDNLYWGTENEVQGMRLTGTSFTIYGGAEPEYDNDLDQTNEDPDNPYSTYEIIDNIDDLPGLVTEIFARFKQI